MTMIRAGGWSVLLLLAATPAALAKDKPRPQPAPTCARASYPGDPVCDIGEPGADLPTPRSRGINGKAEPLGMRVNDDVTIRGRSDFNADRNGPIQFNNPNPHPGLQDVNGGGSVNYRF